VHGSQETGSRDSSTATAVTQTTKQPAGDGGEPVESAGSYEYHAEKATQAGWNSRKSHSKELS